jgi:hypothetical protein
MYPSRFVEEYEIFKELNLCLEVLLKKNTSVMSQAQKNPFTIRLGCNFTPTAT